MDPSLAHLMGWAELTKGDVPPPLTGPSITISPLSSHPPTIFLFGGKLVQNRRLSSAMWAMDLSTRTWERIDAGEGPGPRYFHSMDTWEDMLVCFGGMSDSDPTAVHNDIWFFDCFSRKWLPQPPSVAGLPRSGAASEQDPTLFPSARYAHLSAVSRGRLVISGGQHSDNSWIYEINVFDLKRKVWVSKTEQPEMQGTHSKGAYRSVATSSKHRVIIPGRSGELKSHTTHSYTIDEEDEGGDIWCYSNYDFAKVRRELELISPIEDSSGPASPSEEYRSPPSFVIREQSFRMHGASQPPGLRFPTGGIVGNHLVICGLYLASSSAAFSIWAMNLDTMSWMHLEPSVLHTGSWNRAVLWPEKARILIFGNSQNDLASDYGRRAVNFDNVAVVSLEVYGIYRPPRLEIPAKVQQVGLAMLDEKLSSDFDVVDQDGRRIKCSRQILSERWPWFAEQEAKLAETVAGAFKNASTLDIADTLLGSFTPARLTPTQLNIPEPFPVCVSLVQYFYTLSLSTPLQNRAPVLSALLFLAKQYKIDRLAGLVVHALHERLEPNIAVGIYEIATLSGEQSLQVRALNMIHSAKNGSSSRSHRQGPVGILAAEGEVGRGGTHEMLNAVTSESSGPIVAPAPKATDDRLYRRARADSNTLVDDDEDLSARFAASDLDRTTSSALQVLSSAPRRLLSPPGSPPLDRLPSIPRYPGLTSAVSSPSSKQNEWSSPTTSGATTPYPDTPAESLRESLILPSHESPMIYRRSSSPIGLGLGPVPEHNAVSPRSLNRSFRTIDGATFASPNAADKTLSPGSLQAAQSPRHGPSRGMGSNQAGAVSAISQNIPPRSGSIGVAFNPDRDTSRHYSTSSQSSTSELPATPNSTNFGINLGMPLTQVRSVMDTASISSGSTGASSKMAMKMEKKAIQAADKAARRAESQTKFEALRSEQMKSMAIAKAETQRKVETAARAPPAAKSAPKSKFGKFGAKFAESVLFPSGGEKSTMF